MVASGCSWPTAAPHRTVFLVVRMTAAGESSHSRIALKEIPVRCGKTYTVPPFLIRQFDDKFLAAILMLQIMRAHHDFKQVARDAYVRQ